VSTPGGLIAACKRLGVALSIEGDKLRVRAPNGMPRDLLEDLRKHKPEIMAELRKRHPAHNMAVMMVLPDGRQYWLAPDGMEFDAGGLPVLRRSVLDALVAAGKATKEELRHLIDAAHELGGGDVRMEPQAQGAASLPETEKARSGEMSAPVSGGGAK